METDAKRSSEERIVLPYKFLDKDYRVGDLWDFIDYHAASDDSTAVDMVVGIDFGHGECMAYKRCRLGTGWITVPLYFDSAQSKKLMTVIRYGDDGSITVGKDVSNRNAMAHGGHIFPYFKVPPAQWEHLTGLRDDSGRNITYGRAIRDFMRELWSRILKFDQIDSTPPIREADQNGRLLVAMGCPASSEWTDQEPMEKLKELLQDITGCANVSVMPEPKAALMAPIVSAGKVSGDWKTRLTQLMTTGNGICIYDLGSSTIDFTYVRMGKMLITRSIRLGGSDLDKEMLKQAELLRGKCFGGSGKMQDIKDENTLTLREAKEKYYDGADAVAILVVADGGHSGGMPAKEPIDINAAFMKGVVASGGENSWYRRVQAFFENTKSDVITNLGTENSFNGLIILTGGTSRVSEVSEICENVWKAVEENPFDGNTPDGDPCRTSYTILRDPSSSVATGLAFAKSTECEAAARFPIIRAELDGAYNKAFDSFLMNLSDYCVKTVIQYFEQALQDCSDGQPHMIGEIEEKTNDLIRDSGTLSEDRIQQIMGDLLGVSDPDGKLFACQQEIIRKVNEFSDEIYGGQVNERIILPQMSINDDVSFYISRAVISATVDRTRTTLVNRVFMGRRFLSWVMRRDYVARRLARPLTEANIREALSYINDDIHNDSYDKIKVRRATKELLSDMDDVDLKQPFFRMLDAQLEVALGKILFLVYDDSICK